jgi:hypothetical protein
MSNNELLKPRIKIINDWPGVAGIVIPNTIINVDDEFTDDMFWIGGEPFLIDKIRDYPYLFKELEWWEDRYEKDMPKYLVRKHTTQKDVFKALKHNINATHGLGFTAENGHDKSYVNWLPATQEQYKAYKAKIQNVQPD